MLNYDIWHNERVNQYRQNKSENFLPSQRIDEPTKEEKEIELNLLNRFEMIIELYFSVVQVVEKQHLHDG